MAEYCLSRFTYLYSSKGRYLIRNTFTFEVTELNEAEWNAVRQLKEHKEDYSFILENGLEQLAVSRYIVESDYDEIKQYKQVLFLLKTMSGMKKGLKTYTIFPTTGCNARCVYCYEEGYAVKNMTPDTADRLVEYICETRHDDTVTLNWFGGEPLAGVNIIRRICTALAERGVEYKSKMVTNASLVTREIAHEARELWHLEKVQISLDGAEEDYTQRKNYYSPEKHNYAVVMQAVHYLADEDIKVVLRVNVDMDNIERIPGFLRNIRAEFGDMKNITLYLSALYQAQQGERCLELYKEIFRLNGLQKELGIPMPGNASGRSGRLKVNYCMADCVDKSVVITPEGIFNNCEHLPEANVWGDIFEGVTDRNKYEELSKAPEIDEKCAECPFLPECTPYYKIGCSAWFEKCREYNCMKTEYAMERLLEGVNMESDDDDEV